MHSKAEQSAILIFSKTASHEAAFKTFDQPSGKIGNTLIARSLIRKTIRTARQTGLQVVVHYDTAPASVPFGERLAQAIEAVFQKGYGRVMAIGNDSPELSVQLLLQADQLLQQHPLVLGPSMDGGVYLIGVQKGCFQRATFVTLPWQTAALQSAWQADHPVWMQGLYDIDAPSDFKALFRRLAPLHAFVRLLKRILASSRGSRGPQPVQVLFFEGFFWTSYLRGPPLMVLNEAGY
jgi:glycosyltransferase A (GT-A) superfamily protein (DUF2064 family)